MGEAGVTVDIMVGECEFKLQGFHMAEPRGEREFMDLLLSPASKVLINWFESVNTMLFIPYRYVEGGMDLISKAIGNAAIESGAHVTNVEDPGAQVPTNVTGMLKFGTNLLQAVGQFNGHYVMLVAYMSVTPLQEDPVLQDYLQPVITSVDSDADDKYGQERVQIKPKLTMQSLVVNVVVECSHPLNLPLY
ncbi:hypothetical protein JHK84_040128 [Glycine max]|nr:hypothetical protein JHK84_040128 [Glycine max]